MHVEVKIPCSEGLASKSPSFLRVLRALALWWHGQYLVLESVVAARPQPNGLFARIHTKERWQLSSDSKTLTVKSDVIFPCP